MLPIAFLGVCDSSTGFAEGHEVLWRQDVLGLRKHLVSPVYPWNISGSQFVFAAWDAARLGSVRVSVVSPNGKELMYMTLGVVSGEADLQSRLRTAVSTRPGSPEMILNGPSVLRADVPSWAVFVTTPPQDSVIWEPGCHTVIAQHGTESEPIGYLDCFAQEVPPLSPDRAAAIRASAGSGRTVRLSIACKECRATLPVYAALEKRDSEYLLPDETWYADVPEQFSCSCGKTKIDLRFVKRNLHALLSLPVRQNSEISLVPRYHRAFLDKVLQDLSELLDSDPEEEAVQAFLSSNPVVLAHFGPKRMFYKAPVLTRYKTDICIVNHRSELLLIELEKPGKRLLRKSGGVSSELQHPIDQVTDWLHEIDEHRDAVLSCIGLARDEVAVVRGVVVMGRDRDYNGEALRKLRKRDFGRVEVLTYDDLMAGFASVLQTIGD